MRIKGLDVLVSFCECSRSNYFSNVKQFSEMCGLNLQSVPIVLTGKKYSESSSCFCITYTSDFIKRVRQVEVYSVRYTNKNRLSLR